MAAAGGHGNRGAEGPSSVAGDCDLDPVVVTDVLAGLRVRSLGPRHPDHAVLPNRDRRPVIEVARPALIADQPGGAQPAPRADARDRDGAVGDALLAGRRGARHHEQRPAGCGGRRRVVTGAESGRQDGACPPPSRAARAPGPDLRLRSRGTEAGRRHRGDRAVLRGGRLAETARGPGRDLVHSW
ncbi:MAG TPA: hypothetical protein VH589_03105 [Trebonia sp.]